MEFFIEYTEAQRAQDNARNRLFITQNAFGLLMAEFEAGCDNPNIDEILGGVSPH